MKYDILIIGSGLGGLVSGAILSKNGFNVCVLEKGPKPGGCLQSYIKDGGLFETGVHYIGSMSQGQTLYKILDYLGIIPELSLKQLDVNGFDRIRFKGDSTEYKYAQGYDNFIDTLSSRFPEEHKNIEEYCRILKNVCDKFPLYKLYNGNFVDKLDVIELDTYTEIAKITRNEKLRNVLAATNPLYDGIKHRTPFYIHALIMNSYIESAWRFNNGGNELVNALINVIKQAGGTTLTSKNVTKLVEEGGKIAKIYTEDGDVFEANNVISAIHPSQTVNLVETKMFRPVFRRRFAEFKQTVSPFVVNAVLKKPLYTENSNYYCYSTDNVWDYHNAKDAWPGVVSIFPTLEHQGYYSVSVLSNYAYEYLDKWHNSYSTYYKKSCRGEDYEDLKAQLSDKIIDSVSEIFPEIKNNVSIHSMTGLTYRDHIGAINGSFYGISKDHNDPLKTFILPQTKIPNLFFTGQNLNVHGVYGVTITSLITCSYFIGINNLLYDIQRER
ncbi:MAG: FAD-dependent oxidoreductase [Prevotellaceae bacterium]|jgi:all-trans-retinol 13,14-reductase|nr:FAD-dependent oxidoreductase [Prevotellaceae bacterium]